MMKPSPWPDVVEIDDCGAETTLMVFAHRDAPGFAFRQATADLPVNRVFVRDPSLQGWYNQGLPGLGHDVQTVTEALGRLLRELGCCIVALGSSMGGYAAILFGVKLGAARVMAFNPQTLLDPVFPISPPAFCRREIPDLRAVLAVNVRTKIDIVIGEEDCADIFHAALVADAPLAEVRGVAGSSHLVTEELNQMGLLEPLVRGWLHQTRAAGDPMPWFKDPAFRDAVTGAVPAFLSGAYAEAIEPLRFAETLYRRHPGLPHLRGCALYELGRYGEAVVAQREALRRRPGWSNASHHLNRALDRRGLALAAVEETACPSSI